jgi:hypothetical protein
LAFGFYLLFCCFVLFLSVLVFLSVGRFRQGPGGVAFADRSRRGFHAGLLLHLVDDADGEIREVVVVEVDFAVGGLFEISVLPEGLAEAGFGGFLGVDDDFVLGFGLEVRVLQVEEAICRP